MKYCSVPMCGNSNVRSPNKLFLRVPTCPKRRKKWFQLARRDPKYSSDKSWLYFCEDHFDLPNDMENYIKFSIMGYVNQVKVKLDCFPSKFDCQPGRGKCTTPRSAVTKRQRLDLIQKILSKENEMPPTSEIPNATEKNGCSDDLQDMAIQAETDTQQLANAEPPPSCDSDSPDIDYDDSLAFSDEEDTLRDAEDATEIYAEPDWTTEVLEPLAASEDEQPAACEDCGGDVGGSQWWCVSLGYRACTECATSDASGYWLRAPEGRPQGEVTALLLALRRELGLDTVKEEPMVVPAVPGEPKILVKKTDAPAEEPAMPAESEILVKKEPKEEPDDDPLAPELESDPLFFNPGEQTWSEQVVPVPVARKRKATGQVKSWHTPVNSSGPSSSSMYCSSSQGLKSSNNTLDSKRSTRPGPLILKPSTRPLISKASIQYRVVKLSTQSLDLKPSNDCNVLDNTTGSFITESLDSKPLSGIQILDPRSLSQGCSVSWQSTTAVASSKAPETRIRKRPRRTE